MDKSIKLRKPLSRAGNEKKGSRMSRTYNQGCMLAYALDNLGERWTLLIVRDLLLGPRGFVDLQSSLIGIGGSLLSKRLKDLEEFRLVTTETADGKRSQYRLTELGEQLRPTIRSMMRWSVRFMKETADSSAREQMYADVMKPDSIALGIELYADYQRDPALSYVAHLVVDGRPYTVYYMNGDMIVKRGADTPAMARLETSVVTAMSALRREIDATEARASMKTEGDPIVIEHLIACLASRRRPDQHAEKPAA
jgi:DNA-binding HxlR family transcriptional regulator